MRSPTRCQGTALFWGFLDPSWPGESVDSIYEEGLVVGWSTSIGYDGEFLAIPKEKLENKFWDLVWVPRLGFYPLNGLNPRQLLAFSLDIVP